MQGHTPGTTGKGTYPPTQAHNLYTALCLAHRHEPAGRQALEDAAPSLGLAQFVPHDDLSRNRRHDGALQRAVSGRAQEDSIKT